ncbi:MAG: hypothetical protein ACPG4K_10045, partial [Haloferula sp.]
GVDDRLSVGRDYFTVLFKLMSTAQPNDDQREFRCIHCDGKILVPKSLPPTTGPCPHCSLEITSPGPEAEDKPAEVDPIFGHPTSVNPVAPAKVEEPAPVADEEPPAPVEEKTETPSPKPTKEELEAKAEREARTREAKEAAERAEAQRKEIEAQRRQAQKEREAAQAEQQAAQAEQQARQAEAEAAKRKEAEQKEAEKQRAKQEAAEKEKVASQEKLQSVVASEPSEEPLDASAVEKKGESEAKNKSRGRKVPVAALIVLFLLIGAAAAVFVLGPKFLKGPEGPPMVQPGLNQQLREKQYLESGWEVDAREVLGHFLAADRAAGKAAYSIRGSELLGEMDDFYDGVRIDDSDTPMEAFAVFPLVMKDKQRGIFMLTYDQPPVFELNEFFVPISPLRVQHGVEEPGLLLASVARRTNFTAESLKVHAIFKRTPDGLRLDWETFVQTKYRTMRDFLELPSAGTSKVFRVIMSETVPQNRRVPAGYRTYMVADPAYAREDSARVDVAVDSDIGQALSILNWRGTKEGRAVAKTATVELGWSDEAVPQLQVKKFICWEFLGVGGDAAPAAR